MQPAEITFFAVTLFLSLAALIKWKRRRDVVALRLNRGLRGYVDAKAAVRAAAPHTTPDRALIPA